ncbi:MAG: SDR family oxidoreductase [Pseudomonadota bacterium]
MLFFGFGFSASELAPRLLTEGWRVIGTVRTEEKAERIATLGVEPILFDGTTPAPHLAEAIAEATHAVQSIAPGEDGDAILAHHETDIRTSQSLGWIAYLSTIGVYGDHKGAWIDETAELRPTHPRAKRRVAAEATWRTLGRETGKIVMVFRLAGIYGPGRNQMEQIRRGTARRIIREGQVFNRIHVSDIASALEGAIAHPVPDGVYNVADDCPAPPDEVVAYAASLLGVAPPPEIPFEQADLSPMGRSFYGEVKRTRNDRLKQDFDLSLAFPDYKSGLSAILAGER